MEKYLHPSVSLLAISFPLFRSLEAKIRFAYLFNLIPFSIFNGVLTGGIKREPVLIYNNSENLGTRIPTVPLEDRIDSMTLLLINVSLFEYFGNRKQFNKPKVISL